MALSDPEGAVGDVNCSVGLVSGVMSSDVGCGFVVDEMSCSYSK